MQWRILIDGDEVTAEERQQFELWRMADPMNEQAFHQVTTAWAAFATLDKTVVKPSYFKPTLMDRVLEAFANLLVSDQQPQIRYALVVCTMVLALVGTVFMLQTPSSMTHSANLVEAAYQTGVGELRTVVLADQSSIMLGPDTAIDVKMGPSFRQVELKRGAAVFDVMADPDRPFTVAAESFSAHVVGTVFDVRNNGGVVRLSVSEGVVVASNPLVIKSKPTSMQTRKEVIAGQQIVATAQNGLSKVEGMRQQAFAAWRENRLHYTGAPLSELIADANRYTGRQIVLGDGLSDIADIKVTFTFDANDIDGMLNALPKLFPVTVDRGGDTIIVRPHN